MLRFYQSLMYKHGLSDRVIIVMMSFAVDTQSPTVNKNKLEKKRLLQLVTTCNIH